MKLTFDPAVLSGVQKVPVTTGASVVTPMRDCRHVADDRVDRNFCFVGITEVLAPGVYLFLPGGIPWHFAAKGIGLCFPMVGSGFHYGLELSSLLVLSLCFEIVENGHEDVAFHLSELGEIFCEMAHRQRSFIRLVKIPIPRMMLDQARMIA